MELSKIATKQELVFLVDDWHGLRKFAFCA